MITNGWQNLNEKNFLIFKNFSKNKNFQKIPKFMLWILTHKITTMNYIINQQNVIIELYNLQNIVLFMKNII